MEAFDFHENLKPVRFMMELVGSWPKANAPLPYQISGFATLFIVTAFTFSSALDVVVSFDSLGDAIYAISITLAVFHAIVKHLILSLQKDKFLQLMTLLEDPIFTSHGDLNVYLTRKMRTCKRARRILVYSMLMTALLIVVSPLFEISHRALPVPLPMDVEKQPLLVYILIYVGQSVSTCTTAWVIPGYDGLLIFLIGIAGAQLKILREKIVRSTDGGSNQSSYDHDVLVNSKLRQCVLHHVAIDRYIASIEDMFMISFLIQVLVSLIISVFVGVTFIIYPITSLEFGRSLFFFVAVIAELTMFCVPGNEVILQSKKIHDACYMCEWTECGPSVRKTLLILMERSKRPISLTAAKFVELSLGSLLSILKSSFSYFTVLRQVYSESSTK